MTEIAVTFFNPTGGDLTVDLDDELTASQVVDRLVVHGFIAASPEPYKLSSKRTGSTLDPTATLRAAGVTAGDTLTLLLSATGGAQLAAPTPEEYRRQRVRNESAELLALAGPRLEVRETGPGRFLLTLQLRTIIGSKPTYRDRHRIEVKLSPVHPDGSPEIRALDKPAPFHPNWWTTGRWCEGAGTWTRYSSLTEHVVRMIRSLRFDPEITNPDSPANGKAADWYRTRRNSALFPTDRDPLPGVQAAESASDVRFRPRPGTGRREAR